MHQTDWTSEHVRQAPKQLRQKIRVTHGWKVCILYDDDLPGIFGMAGGRSGKCLIAWWVPPPNSSTWSLSQHLRHFRRALGQYWLESGWVDISYFCPHSYLQIRWSNKTCLWTMFKHVCSVQTLSIFSLADPTTQHIHTIRLPYLWSLHEMKALTTNPVTISTVGANSRLRIFELKTLTSAQSVVASRFLCLKYVWTCPPPCGACHTLLKTCLTCGVSKFSSEKNLCFFSHGTHGTGGTTGHGTRPRGFGAFWKSAEPIVRRTAPHDGLSSFTDQECRLYD